MNVRRAYGTLLLLGGALTLWACDSLLEVDNPNDVTDADIRRGASAAVWVDGALYTVQEAWDWVLAAGCTVSDEILGAGPFGHYRPLSEGFLDNPGNVRIGEFYQILAQGRWMADEAIHVLDSLAEAGDLADSTLLAEAYLYGAIAYATIADWMDDFTFSDRTVAGPAVGPESMGGLYDTAITYLTNALALDDDVGFRRNALAYRARVRHAATLWDQIGQVPISINANYGLVSQAAAVDDAVAALNEDGSDWRYEFDFQDPSPGSRLVGLLWGLRPSSFGPRYVSGDYTDASIVLLDPLDGVPDPWLESLVLETILSAGVGQGGHVSLTVFSAREMHLIIAEDALARADTTTFADEINAIRSLDGLTDWTTASPVSALDMLLYQRQVNLFLQGRRLHDMYRFGIVSDGWETHSVAYTTPGTFFPISQKEIEANCHLNPNVECN